VHKLVVIYNVMICDVLNNEMFDTEIFAFVFLNIWNLSDWWLVLLYIYCKRCLCCFSALQVCSVLFCYCVNCYWICCRWTRSITWRGYFWESCWLQRFGTV